MVVNRLNKLSLKLGIRFFIVILLLEISLFICLHYPIVNSMVKEELHALQTRGNSHRDVLEDSFHENTLRHIALMESKAITDVLITDQKQRILSSSSHMSDQEKGFLEKKLGHIPRSGKVLENNWRNEPYIVTVSPYFIDKNQYGYIYMFKSTDEIQALISQLNSHFILAGVISIILLILTILFLTKSLTTPLLKMKRATEKLSKGDFSVNLPDLGKDELGELSKSITLLGNDLKHLKDERIEFLANISHEIRTPLTYIKGYADIARREGLTKEDRDQYLNIINEEANRLNILLKDLFTLTQIDRNRFMIQKEKVELCPFLNTIYQKVLPAFLEKQMTLQIRCPVRVYAFIDPKRFEQVFINLLDNAIKYSSPHSHTCITVENDKNVITIKVIDQGIGIPKEDMPYIFERLYRVDKSRSRELGGTGLGLSIVKEVIEAHQGTIQVSSILGKGSMFIIKLGVAKE